MTATLPAPTDGKNPHDPPTKIYSYIIAKRSVKRSDGVAYDQWRAECNCGRRTDWLDSPNVARNFGRRHHQHPWDTKVAS